MNTELIARLEAAEVGSRLFDQSVWLACGLGKVLGGPFDAAGNGVWEGPHVTQSLDAALALAERVLPPETMWEVNHKCIISGKKFYCCEFDVPEWGAEIDTYGSASTPSLAVCAAILRALDAQEGA